MRRTISIDQGLAEELRGFAEKKHGMVHGAVKVEAENAIRSYIKKEPE